MHREKCHYKSFDLFWISFDAQPSLAYLPGILMEEEF